MHTKFPETVMVLRDIINEGDVIPPHCFPQELRVNAAVHREMLKKVVKPWIDSMQEKTLMPSNKTVLSHQARTTQT